MKKYFKAPNDLEFAICLMGLAFLAISLLDFNEQWQLFLFSFGLIIAGLFLIFKRK